MASPAGVRESIIGGVVMLPGTKPSRRTLGVRARAAAVAGIVLLAHLALDIVYRPWAFERQPIDLGLAGSFTQVTAVVGVSALMVLLESRALWRDRLNESLVVVAPTAGMLGYEVLQRWLPWTTFDPADLAWTVVGAVVAWAVKRAVYDPVMRQDDDRAA